jgi:hypothetical protein
MESYKLTHFLEQECETAILPRPQIDEEALISCTTAAYVIALRSDK